MIEYFYWKWCANLPHGYIPINEAYCRKDGQWYLWETERPMRGWQTKITNIHGNQTYEDLLKGGWIRPSSPLEVLVLSGATEYEEV